MAFALQLTTGAESKGAAVATSKAVLTISSKNYSSWSLRGWLLARFAGLPFVEKVVAPDDPEVRAEMLLLASSIRVPSLKDGPVTIWDTLAIAEYLNETPPEGRPAAGRARWRARTAARSAARCTPASPTCARRCR